MSKSMHGSTPHDPKRNAPERQDELLLERALFGLSEAEQRELETLLGDYESDDREAGEHEEDLRESDFDASEYELAAAAAALAMSADKVEPLPASLRDKVMAGAKAFHALEAAPPRRRASAERARTERASLDSASIDRTSIDRAPSLRPAAAPRRDSTLAWFVAAAAAVFAVIGWWPTNTPSAPTIVEARAELLARPDTVRVDAKGQEAFAPGATGDIVWSNAEQAGYIRLVGAPANDAKVQQYQLWIFDEAQDNPIDGGVFDVPAGGETLVPIDAKLHVTKPTLFAITLEKPGGVVVSDKQRIAIVAAL